MTPDEIAKHGLRVTPRKRRDMDIVWQMNADSFHEARICAALEPIAPPDVAQAARVAEISQAKAAGYGDAIKDLHYIKESHGYQHSYEDAIVDLAANHGRIVAALRVIAGEAP